MGNILLVSETTNFIVGSIKNQLEELDHDVVIVSNDPDEIKGVRRNIHLIIIYEEEMIAQGLVFVKDKAIEKNIPIFIIGDADKIREAEDIIPGQFIKKRFIRPINVKDVVLAVDKYINDDDRANKKKILVVDDSGAVLRNVKAWLEDKYQVILANSGAMAIKYLAMNHPDLILLDYEMPICDGSQVLEMIRSESEFSDMPVIFLTSKNDRESVLKVSALKPDGYLLKSMEPKQIVQTIDDFFEKRKWTV